MKKAKAHKYFWAFRFLQCEEASHYWASGCSYMDMPLQSWSNINMLLTPILSNALENISKDQVTQHGLYIDIIIRYTWPWNSKSGWVFYSHLHVYCHSLLGILRSCKVLVSWWHGQGWGWGIRNASKIHKYYAPIYSRMPSAFHCGNHMRLVCWNTVVPTPVYKALATCISKIYVSVLFHQIIKVTGCYSLQNKHIYYFCVTLSFEYVKHILKDDVPAIKFNYLKVFFSFWPITVFQTHRNLYTNPDFGPETRS